MSKAKGKGGTGKGTDKKGWNRWQASANRAKNSPKPYTSKGTKNAEGAKAASSSASSKASNNVSNNASSIGGSKSSSNKVNNKGDKTQ